MKRVSLEAIEGQIPTAFLEAGRYFQYFVMDDGKIWKPVVMKSYELYNARNGEIHHNEFDIYNLETILDKKIVRIETTYNNKSKTSLIETETNDHPSYGRQGWRAGYCSYWFSLNLMSQEVLDRIQEIQDNDLDEYYPDSCSVHGSDQDDWDDGLGHITAWFDGWDIIDPNDPDDIELVNWIYENHGFKYE